MLSVNAIRADLRNWTWLIYSLYTRKTNFYYDLARCITVTIEQMMPIVSQNVQFERKKWNKTEALL